MGTFQAIKKKKQNPVKQTSERFTDQSHSMVPKNQLDTSRYFPGQMFDEKEDI